MKKKKCCKNCDHYDPRNRFCRALPPTPTVIDIEDDNGNYREYVLSKYPVIPYPTTDWCDTYFKEIII